MWFAFVFAVLACLAFLYLPGFLFCRGVNLSSLSSLAVAPLVSVACYCMVGVLYERLSIFCTWLNVFLPILVPCAVLFCWRMTRHDGNEVRVRQSDWPAVALYVVVGIVLGVYLFCIALDTPYSIVSEYDNAFHVDVVRAFVDSGIWSVLDVSKYLTPDDMSISPLGGGAFYPAAWHILCASIVSLTGCSVVLVENAVDFAITCTIFPVSMAYLALSIFRERRIVLLGAFTMLAFVSYPWVLFIWGPLLSNVFAFALVPAIAGLFIRIVDGFAERWVRASGLIVFALGFIALVFSQPNALFFCVVLLTPYCVYRLWTFPEGISLGSRRVSGRTLAVVFFAFVVIIWFALPFAPFMRQLISEGGWMASYRPIGALTNILTLDFGWFTSQEALAVLVAVGIVFTVLHREHLWITVAYLFFCLAYFLSAGTDGLLKHFIAGYWYCDSYRLAACMAMVGALLAALGLEGIIELLQKLLSKHACAWKICSVMLVIVFCVLNYSTIAFIGGWDGKTPLGQYWDLMKNSNSHDNEAVHFSASEREFIERVKELVPEGSLVVNLPDDGSAYAYGVNELRIYYREYRGYEENPNLDPKDETWETAQSQFIRTKGFDVSNDTEVRAAFDAIGAEYVMLLDYGDALYGQHLTPFFNEGTWAGLLAIRDDTPGFEIVLSENDMRLYRIMSDAE